MKVDGLHHVTAITADIEANLNSDGRLVWLRLVRQGANADDSEMRAPSTSSSARHCQNGDCHV